MQEVDVAILVSKGATCPEYQTDLAAGADLRARISEPILLSPGERRAVPTGLVIAIPEGYEAQVRPRSGLALREGLTCINSPGTIDADYRGEIIVPMVNLGEKTVTIRNGDRIAQLVVAPVARAHFIVVDALDATLRGDKGFGSTGIS